MKKKILCFAVLAFSILTLTACKTGTDVVINDYVVEERCNLFVAQNDTYCVTFSTGLREENYALDGEKHDMVDFGVLTLARLDHNPLAINDCEYTVTIDDQILSGKLLPSGFDNSFSADLGTKANDNSVVSVNLKFDGVTFSSQLENTSGDFTVDKETALKIANAELKNELKNLAKDKTKFEVVMKIVRDYSSSEVKSYYWYVGVVATNGQTYGILIDAISGDIIAKKV